VNLLDSDFRNKVTMQNKVIAAITITGFQCSHDEITKIIKIQPTRIWRLNDPVVASRPNARRQKENGWKFEVQISNNAADSTLWLSEALKILTATLAENANNFKDLPPLASVEISCYLRINKESMPEIFFTNDLLKLIASINASIDLDIVCD